MSNPQKEMKVVALISGGKDSLFSICKCIAYGHQVVALANLGPEDPNVQDADSYMYQTVGHHIVEAYAKALKLPLFRKSTQGKALVTTLGYTSQPSDEVEDLYQLLLQVKQEMPQVEAVCSGAILSDYQRNRVENVCARLRLQSIAYLWRRNQKELLLEMLQSGIDAIVIKVASMGLYPRKHLGKHLVELVPVLMDLESKYGSNICGEGGELESLVLDCPLFYYRLIIDQAEPVTVSEDRFAPIGYLRIKKYHLQEKAPHVNRLGWIKTLVPIKPMPKPTTQRETCPPIQDKTPMDSSRRLEYLCSCKSRWCKTDRISYFLCCGGGNNKKEQERFSREANKDVLVEEITKDILQELEEALKESSLSREDVFYCQLYLDDMSLFARVNEVYASYFGLVEPPSRACIEITSTKSQPTIMLEAFVCKKSGGEEPRKVVHIQSISEWAPPCIGPYSQACCFPHFVFMSGILPLYPPTVTIPPGLTIEMQTKLCIENVNQTMQVLPCTWKDILFIYAYITRPQDAQQVASLLYDAYGKQQFGLCVLPVRNLPRNGAVELQLLCTSTSANSSHPFYKKRIVQGEYSLQDVGSRHMNSSFSLPADDSSTVTWQLCAGGSMILLHATWNPPPSSSSFKQQVTAMVHQWTVQLDKQLDPVGAHVAWTPLVGRLWLPPTALLDCNNLQDMIEDILVKVLSNARSINRTPAFIIPLEQDEKVRMCHLQLILQLDKVSHSRL